VTEPNPDPDVPAAAAPAAPVAEASSAPPSMALDKKKSIIAGLVAVVFLVIVFATVIPKFGNYAAAWTSIQSMPAGSLAALVAALLVYLFFYGWPFVASVPGLKYWQGQIVNESAFAISNGVPAGGALGLGLQYAQLSTYGATPTAATAGITATGVWSIFLTLGLPVLGVLALVVGGDNASGYYASALLGLAALLAMIIVFALILRSEELARKIGGIADRTAHWFLRLIKRDGQLDLTAQVLKLRGDIVDLVKRRWAAITAAQLAVSLSQFAILLVAMIGESGGELQGISALQVFAAFAISQLGLMIPVTPGGLGTVDAAMIALMVKFGADDGQATAADLVWRATSFIPQIIIGLICIGIWRINARHLKEREATEGAVGAA
jgi:uncharacterized protein (TIRG00374 family)